jgi:hypothetical protein
MRTKDPSAPPPVFTRGVAIAPAEELAAWLDGHDGRLVRLPVTLEVDVLSSARATHVGGLELDVSDVQMGVSLAMHLHGAATPGQTVTVWLAGVWSAADRRLYMRAFGGVVDEDDDDRSFALISG